MSETTFEQGLGARPFKEQFPHLQDEDAAHLDAINKAITTLYMAGMLPDSQRHAIRAKKFPREVAKVLKRNTKRATQAAKQGEQP